MGLVGLKTLVTTLMDSQNILSPGVSLILRGLRTVSHSRCRYNSDSYYVTLSTNEAPYFLHSIHITTDADNELFKF